MPLRTRTHRPTPLRAVGLGLLAGVGGTAVMTAVQLLEQRLRGSSSEPPQSWDEAPAPAQVGKRVVEGVFQEHVDLDQAEPLTNAVHWLYGIGWGAAYGVLRASVDARPAPLGAVFGAGVMGAGYTVLPAMKIYDAPWKYPLPTLLV